MAVEIRGPDGVLLHSSGPAGVMAWLRGCRAGEGDGALDGLTAGDGRRVVSARVFLFRAEVRAGMAAVARGDQLGQLEAEMRAGL